MSADNWTACPRCRKRAEDAIEAAWMKAERSYGKVSAARYEEMRAEAAALTGPEDTLREDYDLGIHDGRFEVCYRAACQVCGFEFTFRHGQDLPGEVRS